MPDTDKLEGVKSALNDLEHEYKKFKNDNGHKGFPVLQKNIDQIKDLAFDLWKIADAEDDVERRPDNKYNRDRYEAKVKEFLEYY